MFLNQDTHGTAKGLSLLIQQMREVATKCAQEDSSEALEIESALSIIDRVTLSNRSAARYVDSGHYQSLQRLTLGNNLNSLRIAAENVSAAQSVVLREEHKQGAAVTGLGFLTHVSSLIPKQQENATHLSLSDHLRA